MESQVLIATVKDCFAYFRIPHHQEVILKALLQLVADLCPSSSVIPSSQGK